MLPVHACCQH